MNNQDILQQLSDIVGAANFIDQTTATEHYGKNTLSVEHPIQCAVKISNQAQIIAIVKLANQHQISLYPISTGNNWGYGSATPVATNSIIVDMSQMNQIVECDEQLGIVTIEPGVTHGQLSQYFIDNNLEFLVPTHGGGPNCSVLGNALERGYGITPIADHFSAVTHIEAILSNGEKYQPLLSELCQGPVDKLYKWGTGPYLDGLLTQSGLAIVTQITITLARRAPCSEVFLFSLDHDCDLELAVKVINQTLKQLNGLTSSINIINTRRALSMMVPYPKDQSADSILPDQYIDQLAAQNDLGAWTGLGALYGEPQIVKAARKLLKQQLNQLPGRHLLLNDRRLKMLSFIAPVLPQKLAERVTKLVDTVTSVKQILNGQPNEMALPLAYWRSQAEPQDTALDPDRDNCGLRWYTPLVPMDSRKVREYVSMVERICRQYNIEPLITLTSLSERCFDSSIPLLFDKTQPGSEQRVKQCYQALFEQGRKLGFIPYRYGIDTMDLIAKPNSDYWPVANAIKQALDPNHIIAPGRYSSKNPKPQEHI